VNLRTSCRNQAHGVVAKLGITVPVSDLFGMAGSVFLVSPCEAGECRLGELGWIACHSTDLSRS